jgi:pimeloyl-ACP methyl ester carboxylesterase
MSLTGPLTGTLVTVIAVAAFAGLVTVWPALAGRRAATVAGRAGALVVVNALILLAVAVQLNDQYLFFADWADLRGAFGGTTTASGVQRGGDAQRAAAARVSGGGLAGGSGRLLPLPAGTPVGDGAVSYRITGPAGGITGTVVIAVPPGYADPRNAAVRYPVLETFQGYPSEPTMWMHTMGLPTVLAARAGAGRVRPALIVSPQVEVPPGVDTECVNGRPGTPQLETWLTQDVPDWVATRFRVATDRSSWAAMGLSAGGWCAAMTAMLHPGRYAAAVVLGGYFRPEFGPFYEPYPPGSPLAQRYDLVRLARRSPPSLALWLETSHADPVSYGSSAALLKATRPPLSVTAVVLQNAGHRDSVWKNLLPNVLDWLGRTVPGFRPGP